MIVNAFSVISAFAAGLRVVGGLLLLLGAWHVWRRRGDLDESRYDLLSTVGVVLLGISVVSWPLLYLVLQSYVPVWPGVMCIAGVTRIGALSTGAAGALPGLVGFLQFAKPALVFLAGLWFVLHRAHRAGRQGHTGPVLVAVLAFGSVAVADGAAESAYLFIPKKERVASAGCCSPGATRVELAAVGPLTVTGGPREDDTPLTVAFFAVGAALTLALSFSWLWASTLLALVSLPVGYLFLGAVAAPAFLRLPYHECAYCLIRLAPEALVGIGLYLGGAFAVGWAVAARGHRGAFLRFARYAYLGALLMTATRLVTA